MSVDYFPTTQRTWLATQIADGDRGLLLNAWGVTAPSGAGDVNHDGQVDGADLALMLNSWGFCD